MSKKSTAAHTAASAPAPAAAKLDKAAKFRALATKRVNRTVHAIHLLANLANRSSYEYTVDQAALLLASLEAACQRVEDAFTKSVAKAKDAIQF